MEQDIRISDEHDMPDIDQDEQDYQDKLLFDDGALIGIYYPENKDRMLAGLQAFREEFPENDNFRWGKYAEINHLKYIDRYNPEMLNDTLCLGILIGKIEQKYPSTQQTNQTPEYGC